MTFLINDKKSLEDFTTKNFDKMHQFITQKMEGLPVPFTSSVDIREGHNKLASIDHNMYPAGFNNLCAKDLDASLDVFQEALKKICPKSEVIGLHPESHTKNLFYLSNISFLSDVIGKTGHDVVVLSFDKNLFIEGGQKIELVAENGKKITIHQAFIGADQKIYLHDHSKKIDIVIMNHDQSSPLNVDWKALKTPVLPHPLMGWFHREKNKHFSWYKKVVDDFCQNFSINPSLMQARFKAVEDIDFNSKQGLDHLGDAIEQLQNELFQDSGVKDAKVFIKASKGTYGMGIMVIGNRSEVENINRKDRNKMDIGKNKIKFTSVLVQEGIETIVKHNDSPAEITIYLIDGNVIGGFVRANTKKDELSNLNSNGMIFSKFCMSELKENKKCKECLYSIVARLAVLAAAYETKEMTA